MRIAVDADLQGAIDAALGDEAVGVDLAVEVLLDTRRTARSASFDDDLLPQPEAQAFARSEALSVQRLASTENAALTGFHEDR